MRAADTRCVETRGDDAAVVEDEQVSGMEELRQITKEVITILACSAVKDEHAAGAAHGRRRLGDQLLRKIEMKVGYAHSSNFSL